MMKTRVKSYFPCCDKIFTGSGEDEIQAKLDMNKNHESSCYYVTKEGNDEK